MEYDVLVIGGGIAGMESGLTLGDMGYKVLLVEKEVSIGGKMILLSKVFPTLDCSSCISTPKMAATAHHPNLTVLTFSEVEGIVRKDDGAFSVRLLKKPTFVDPAACTGCGDCELACTVAISDKFNAGLVATRAAHIAFPQAVPKKAVIERAGSSPCSFTCPAGIQAHGYVSLIRSGEYEKAFQLVLDATPLVGTLGRACYAPCEVDCTRGSLEGPLPIRRLKRFIADEHYERFDGPGLDIPEPNGHRVAVVGSGPAGRHRTTLPRLITTPQEEPHVQTSQGARRDGRDRRCRRAPRRRRRRHPHDQGPDQGLDRQRQPALHRQGDLSHLHPVRAAAQSHPLQSRQRRARPGRR